MSCFTRIQKSIQRLTKNAIPRYLQAVPVVCQHKLEFDCLLTDETWNF